MKKLIFTLIIVGILFSCNSDDDSNSNTDLIGNWQLIEVLADPGDGSGIFSSVESEKTITFDSEGIIGSNGDLCNMGTTSDNPTSGTYSKSERSFNLPNCPEYNFTFEQNGNILIINYPCVEACAVKYKKI